MLLARALTDLRTTRVTANVSQARAANALGWSQARLWRTEAGQLQDIGLVALSELASVLGCELSLGVHPIGDPVRDKGQLALGRRFDALLADCWRGTDEVLLPGSGERRAWDKLLRLTGVRPHYLVGVDLETRVHDVQQLVRRTRLRERDGHVDAILLVLADTAHDRRIRADLVGALGSDYETPPRGILNCLRVGRRLPGSGVILL